MTARALRLGALLVVALALVLAPATRAADEAAGTRAASFLASGGTPAVLAMGGATLALGRDVQGAAWNPAALGWLGSRELSFAHAQLADESAQEWIGYGGRVGGGATRFGLGALLRDEGTIAGRDANDQPIGDLHAQDAALALQLARPFGPHLAIGGAARVVDQRIGTVSGAGFAFDAGAQLRLGPLALAVAGQNFGGGMRWQGQQWRMPASLGAGLALEHAASGLAFALDWNAPADYWRDVRAGVEWRWHDRIALRGGWRGELGAPEGDRLGGPAFGLGAGAGAFWLDYGYVIASDGTATHRMGLTLRGAPRTLGAASH